MLSGQKPHLEGLRTFGEEAYVHIPSERRGEFEPRAQRCKFIGYAPGSKGWKFFNFETNKLVESSMAVFTEDKDPVLDVEQHDATSKGNLRHILNTLQLGDFDAEEVLLQQDALVTEVENNLREGDPTIPKTYREAMERPDAMKWKAACEKEMGQFEEMGVWVESDLPGGRKVTDAKWVFDIKRDGTYKARYVARGFSQVQGVDFTKTFAPTATFAALRMIVTLAAMLAWPTFEFNVTTAYLHSDMDEDVWVRPPPGFGRGQKVMKCLKALYGTKQAGRCWWKFIADKLERMGFQPSQFNTSFYVFRRGHDTCLLWLHVDDGAVTGSILELLKEIEEQLSAEIKIKWGSELTSIVGVDIKRTSPRCFHMSQPKLTERILSENNDLLSVLSADNPISVSTKLEMCFDRPAVDGGRFLSVIGSLSYLAVGTRLDLSYLVNFLTRYAKEPQEAHWLALRHLLRYLRNTAAMGIIVDPSNNTFEAPMETFVDANWGGEFARSSYGHVTRLFGVPIAWVARRQSCVATSTCHAEFMAIGAACRDAVWLHSLATDMLPDLPLPMLLCDNSSLVHVSRDNSAKSGPGMQTASTNISTRNSSRGR